MGLLFDENLSARLAPALADIYPGSVHVSDLGLNGASDSTIWEAAKLHGLAIVSKDGDFQRLSDRDEHPPKVIWLRLGNCSTEQIADLLRRRQSAIMEFMADNKDDKEARFLVIE